MSDALGNVYDKWKQCVLPVTVSVQIAIKVLNDVALQIVLVADENRKLVGTISDGDIRRGLLKGLALSSGIESIVNTSPLVVPEALSREDVLQLMSVNKVRQIPIVDREGRLVGLHLWDDMNSPRLRANRMVIMAGGKGTRLRPHTESCPKPMLEVGGRPILEHIIERAKLDGITQFVITLHYLGHVIQDYFGSGESHGVCIEYLQEETPLGTAGALSLLTLPKESILVTNGDVITDIHYSELLDFHERHEAVATMAVRSHEWQHPYGVVSMQGIEIVGLEEKPISRSYVNAGVYALSPKAMSLLSKNLMCDMPMLFDRLRSNGMRTVAYPMHEPWLDVGRPEDLNQANHDHNINLKRNYE